ncbi:MAG: GMC oxidoreductase [Deltaproteobacteria bacterium]|nr:GMC oxidoreductase [Deltaproteobacteria bacterium]
MGKSVVVIGAGLAGSLLCNELSRRFNVTLLERGRENRVEVPNVRFVNKDLAGVPTFCYGGGGTTNLWHNGLIPINATDIHDPEFRQVFKDCQPFLDQAAASLFFKKRPFQAEYEKLVAEVNSLSERLSVFPQGIDCLIYPKRFQKLTVDSTVRGFYQVKDIDFSVDGKRIRSVTFRTDQTKHTIDADVVVVSAGALGTPRVLGKILASIGLADDNVGVGLIDHPTGFVGKVRFKKGIANVIRELSTYDKGEYISRNAIRLKSSCGKYTACVFFRPAVTMANNLAIYKYKSLLGASSGILRLKNAFSNKIFHPDIIAEIFEHLFGVSIPGRTFNILFVGEQKRGANRVFYKGDDLYVDWSISEHELNIYREMLAGLKAMLEGLADEINIQTDITDDWLWSIAHHSGTVSMGDTDDALVDRDLRLRHFDNVFVCDGSVIQEHSYANTGLAIGQLAFRLAKHIRDAYQ